jgi:tRNA modification GTPase
MPTPRPDDTIAAISTPLGTGGIAVVRLSGERAIAVAGSVFSAESGRPLDDQPSHTVAYGITHHPGEGEAIDRCLATVFKAPASYTAEDTVEISCHGGPLVAQAVLEACLAAGARAAEPGEFTKRAFLNGKLDLAQAEAVAALIEARTQRARSLASAQLEGRLSQKIAGIRARLIELSSALEAEIDFPDDVDPADRSSIVAALSEEATEIEGLAESADAGISMRHGAKCVIAGRPNVGKSTLMNALLGRDRVIVSPAPGTTRDVVEDWVDISGVPVRLTDTAGLREVPGEAQPGDVERMGIERARAELAAADLVVFVLDSSEPAAPEDQEIARLTGAKPTVLVLNKIDLPERLGAGAARGLVPSGSVVTVRTSLVTGEGIAELEEALGGALLGGSGLDADGAQVQIIEARHKDALLRGLQSVHSALDSLSASGPSDLISDDLRAALDALGEITGETATDEIIDGIFERFCVGK